MQKLVSVDAVRTPAGKVTQAEEILGLRVVDPSTRFNPGTLAGRITSALDAAAVVVISPGRLLALNMGGVAGSVDGFLQGVSECPGIISSSPILSVVADAGRGRSRALLLAGDNGEVTPASLPAEMTNDFDSDLASALLLPALPQWTAAGALSAIYDELQGRETPLAFVAVLDQFSGEITVYSFTDAAGADAAALVYAVNYPEQVEAAFTLSDPAAPPPGVVGPVWG
jgi:hypothetical protein